MQPKAEVGLESDYTNLTANQNHKGITKHLTQCQWLGLIGTTSNHVPSVPAHLSVVYEGCPKAFDQGIWWPKTKFGRPAAMNCPKGSIGEFLCTLLSSYDSRNSHSNSDQFVQISNASRYFIHNKDFMGGEWRLCTVVSLSSRPSAVPNTSFLSRELISAAH